MCQWQKWNIYIQKNSAYRLTGLDSRPQIPHRRKLETGSLKCLKRAFQFVSYFKTFYVSRKDAISKLLHSFQNSMAKVSIGIIHILVIFPLHLKKLKS